MPLLVDVFKEHEHGYLWDSGKHSDTVQTNPLTVAETKYLILKDVGQTLQWKREEGDRKKTRRGSECGSQCFHVLPVLPLTYS